MHGQHGRASLKAIDLLGATRGKKIPEHLEKPQGNLFENADVLDQPISIALVTQSNAGSAS